MVAAARLSLLLPCVLLVLLLLPTPTMAVNAMFVCPEGSEGPADQPLGAECGGHCSSKGTCAKGLVCGPNEEGEAFLLSMPSKLASFVRSSLGRAPVGRCVAAGQLNEEEEEMQDKQEGESVPLVTRELLQDDMLRQEGNLLKSRREQTGTCPGCPHAVDVNNEDVVAAARAGLEMMKTKGEFGTSEADRAKVTLARIVSATSQVVSGIRYHLLLAVTRVPALTFYEVDVVSQPWMTGPKYTLVGFKKVEAPVDEEGGGRKK